MHKARYQALLVFLLLTSTSLASPGRTANQAPGDFVADCNCDDANRKIIACNALIDNEALIER